MIKTMDIDMKIENRILPRVSCSMRALKNNDPQKHFFLEFVTLLNPGTHLCECNKCGRPTDKEESQPLSDYEYPFLEIEAHDDDEPEAHQDRLQDILQDIEKG